MRLVILAAALMVSACASAPNDGWTGGSRQSYETSRAACQQISGGSTENYRICMAGRGWTKAEK